MKTQIEIAKNIADQINANEDYRATIKQGKSGEQFVDVQKDTGGKRGFIGAGRITVGTSVEVDDDVQFAFRYDRKFLQGILDGLEPYAFVEQAETAEVADDCPRLKEVAKRFRQGYVVDDDDLVACVKYGLISQNQAMNRDW